MNHQAEVVAIGAGTGAGGEEVPAVLLAARGEIVPIFVTPDQANSIGMTLEGEPFERPLTHDLLVDVLTEFGGAVDRVRIDDLSEGTFYAKVDVERYDDGEAERFVFDARPSDALAVGVRVECPIVVADAVIDEAGQPAEAFGFDVEPAEGTGNSLDDPGRSGDSGPFGDPSQAGDADPFSDAGQADDTDPFGDPDPIDREDIDGDDAAAGPDDLPTEWTDDADDGDDRE